MGIFLSESYTNVLSNSNSEPSFNSAYLQNLCETLNINEKAIADRFGDENAGMAICYESEVAWNTLMEEMKVAEFTALNEGMLGNFWAKIVEWAKKIVAFFVRVWKAIVAWIKKVWSKVVGFFVTSDDELRKKLVSVSSSIKVEKEVYKGLNIGESTDTYVKEKKEAIKGIYNEVAKALSSLGSDDQYQKKIDSFVEKHEKGKAKIDEIATKLGKVKIDRAACLKELANFDTRMKPLVEYLKDTEAILTAGTKAAEKAKEKAEKAANTTESKLLKADSEKNKKDFDEKDEANKTAQKEVRNAVGIANTCRKVVTDVISSAQRTKNLYFKNHDIYRSAAKELISKGKKAK